MMVVPADNGKCGFAKKMRVCEQDILIAGIELDGPSLISTKKHQAGIVRDCARYEALALI
jgi:hypothetical protein